MTLLIVVAVLVALVLIGVGMYNGLVRMREQVDAAWSNIDVELKRRHDLIPNLVETVKGYATHEKATLESVIQARNAAMSAQGPADRAAAENMLTGALKSIFALSEAYPDLKANQNFRELQTALSTVEDHIQRARSSYNNGVQQYNTKVRQVPTNLIATAFGFDVREFFEIEEEARAVPQVKF
ncbi:MAG: LemA family protein [Gemmatimonadota bacterium]